MFICCPHPSGLAEIRAAAHGTWLHLEHADRGETTPLTNYMNSILFSFFFSSSSSSSSSKKKKKNPRHDEPPPSSRNSRALRVVVCPPTLSFPFSSFSFIFFFFPFALQPVERLIDVRDRDCKKPTFRKVASQGSTTLSSSQLEHGLVLETRSSVR